MRLLVTRPVAEAEATARRLEGLGHQPFIEPLSRIEALDPPPPLGKFAAVLATSANAFVHAPRWLQDAGRIILDLPCFVVGQRTAAAAKAAGFSEIRYPAEASRTSDSDPLQEAGGDALALAQWVADTVTPGETLLYLAGQPRRPELEQRLGGNGFTIEVVECYRAQAIEELSPALIAAIEVGALDGVLHYSPRAAALFAGLSMSAGLAGSAGGLRHYCLSKAVAASLAPLGPADVRLAARPDQDAMLALLQPPETPSP